MTFWPMPLAKPPFGDSAELIVFAEMRSRGTSPMPLQKTPVGDSAELKLRGYWCDSANGCLIR